jgi:hypothetical protein
MVNYQVDGATPKFGFEVHYWQYPVGPNLLWTLSLVLQRLGDLPAISLGKPPASE